MARTVLSVIAFLALCIASFAQDAGYYKAIQKASSSKVQPAQFKQMEENALKDSSRPESYELLATSFGNTTEKVWAVIYGEVYCNLSSDSDRISQVGSLVYHWYEGSLSRQGNGLSADPTENAQSSPKQVPFESLFEQSFLMGAVGLKADFPPLSVPKADRDPKEPTLALESEETARDRTGAQAGGDLVSGSLRCIQLLAVQRRAHRGVQ